MVRIARSTDPMVLVKRISKTFLLHERDDKLQLVYFDKRKRDKHDKGDGQRKGFFALSYMSRYRRKKLIDYCLAQYRTWVPSISVTGIPYFSVR